MAVKTGNTFNGLAEPSVARVVVHGVEPQGLGSSQTPMSGTYRMRGYDTSLGEIVYWSSDIIDGAGIGYVDPASLDDIVVSSVTGPTTYALIPGTGIETMPEQWVKLNVPASQAATAMAAQVSTNFDTIKAIRAGSVIGLGTRLSESITAGTLTVRLVISGNPMTLQLVHTSGLGGQVTQAANIDNYVAGDLIGIQYQTDAGFLPITADLEAWLQVVEVP